jgi:hypothetical protein
MSLDAPKSEAPKPKEVEANEVEQQKEKALENQDLTPWFEAAGIAIDNAEAIFNATTFYPNGRIKYERDAQSGKETYYYENGNKKTEHDPEKGEVKQYYETGTLRWIETKDMLTYYSGENGRPLFEQTVNKPSIIRLILPNGERLGSYTLEREKNPALTEEDYIAKLATYLTTPESWFIFANKYMKYTKDGFSGGIADHWQRPEETLSRVNERGQCLGDCDDYAFLAQAILARQGVKAKILYFSDIYGAGAHATCVWIEKSPDGTYSAYSIGTSGYDRNGDHSMYRSQAASGVNPEGLTTGFETPELALDSLLEKYKTKTSLGVQRKYKKIGRLRELQIGESGRRVFKPLSYESLVNE